MSNTALSKDTTSLHFNIFLSQYKNENKTKTQASELNHSAHTRLKPPHPGLSVGIIL